MYKIELCETIFESDTDDLGGYYCVFSRKESPQIRVEVPIEELLFFVNDYFQRQFKERTDENTL